MRIAYFNPYINSAENQIFKSMRFAAVQLGLDLVECKDETDIYSCDPDFVLSVTSQLPRMTHHPTYLAMHEPKFSIFEWKPKFPNILSYDGYVTISDSLVRFIHDFSYGVGRSENPGFFYPTAHKSEISTDWRRIAETRKLRIAYFGTNWKNRSPGLLSRLDKMNILDIHGPEASWKGAGYQSYRGPVPFDGSGPQKVYATLGAGLVLLDEHWLNEDVISNRIFEISSVGAMAICPEMPWIRKWFGDSVLYYDATLSDAQKAEQIGTAHEFCLQSPALAEAKAARAREIFETHFSADRMLANLVDYHERKQRELPARIAAAGPPARITVILRCGGRPIEMLARAVNSITAQTFGQFHIVLAKYREIDTSALTATLPGNVLAFSEFTIPDGGRAEMLFAGLERIDTEYFAVLDDDDLLLPDHFEALFAAGRRVNPGFDVAFSGTLDIDNPTDIGAHTLCNRNISRFGFDRPVQTAWDVYTTMHLGSFVARADLLMPGLIQAPAMKTAEDSLLVGLVSRRTKPVFSYRPTLLYTANSADGSNWQHHPERRADEISLVLRAGLLFGPAWMSGGESVSPVLSALISAGSGSADQDPPPMNEIVAQVLTEAEPRRGRKPDAERSFLVRLFRRPSILLGPLAPRWRSYKAARRARRAAR